jgi:eukaryotic translation initiation factor 2C
VFSVLSSGLPPPFFCYYFTRDQNNALFRVNSSGEGSQPSGTSEDTTLSNMARAVQVHPDANNVMYFA